MAVTIDTHAAIRELKSADADAKLAEAIVATISGVAAEVAARSPVEAVINKAIVRIILAQLLIAGAEVACLKFTACAPQARVPDNLRRPVHRPPTCRCCTPCRDTTRNNGRTSGLVAPLPSIDVFFVVESAACSLHGLNVHKSVWSSVPFVTGSCACSTRTSRPGR